MKIVIITSIVVLLWCVIYKTCHSRKDTPLASGSDFPNANTMNGCGASLYGGFRIQGSDLRIYYVMLSAFFLPFIPFGCFVATKKGTKQELLGKSSQLEIHGKTKTAFLELL